MATAFYSSYKPQVLSRQEGFHLPSPAPSTPPSSDGTPSSLTNHTSSSANAFDTHNLFISPPSYLSVPETFRKFPSTHNDHAGHGASSMDFSDELASLMSHPHPSSHERSTQSPVSVSSYDDYQRPTTHNIFDISAPNTHHHHSSSHSSSHHVPHSPHSPFPSNGSSAFSLPPSSSLSSTTAHGLHTPGSSLQTPTHPLHEFTSHFNSTVPAIGSSMRYEPPSSSHGHSSNGPSSHPFALNVNTSGSASHNNNNSPNSNSSGNEPSSYTSHTFPDSFPHLNGSRQTPSPVLPPSSGRPGTSDYSRVRDEFSRSRSRSRSQAQPPLQQPEPPSTNGGPARTRTTRPKRNSISSVSPPPTLRGHLTQPLVIPTSSPVNGSNAPPSAGPRSPLSLHTSGWFQPGSLGTTGINLNGINGMNGINSTLNGMNGYGGLNTLNTHSIGSVGSLGEFSLPTPDSVHGFFGGQGSSPKELGGLASPTVSSGAMNGKEGQVDDVAAKQAQIANEKRRRRRESHNAVERRRRDNINEKISELATLIPECLLDPNSTLTVPATVSSASDDALLGAGALSSPNPNKESASPEANSKKEEDFVDKDSDSAGAVKANKGMILRKSVEYIRYLQQLVSVQATRNRELEQQLHSYRGGKDSPSPSLAPNGNEEDALMLHEEVGDFNLSLNGHSESSTSSVLVKRHNSTNGSSRKRFGGIELESVAEMEQDTDDHDHDMERPSTSGTGAGGASPLSGSGSDDQDHEQEEEERGRKGRDGRPMGFGLGNGLMALKVEEGDGMETC